MAHQIIQRAQINPGLPVPRSEAMSQVIEPEILDLSL
jgi:hypothetical protein